MSALAALLTLALFAAAYLAVRGARPASPPYGRRLAWIALLLAAQMTLLYGFTALHHATGWGVAGASPPGLAFATQALRAALLLLALRAWWGLAGEELRGRISRTLVAACGLALGWSGGGTPILAAIVLGFVLQRQRWVEQLGGWRRALGLALAVGLLLALSLRPFTAVGGGVSDTTIGLGSSPWPPPLLLGEPAAGAAAELALARPLDRLAQAILDLLRVQLWVLAAKLLFLPIRLSGMSLKRRFTINFLLVRSIPAALSAILIVGLVYLSFGDSRLMRVRARLEQTLARAGTAAAALAADRGLDAADAPAAGRLREALAWIGEDAARASVIVREDGRVRLAGAAVPAGLRADSLAERHGVARRGLAAVGDTLYLLARHLDGARAVEVYVPVEPVYLRRVMDPIGGDLRVTALPDLYVGGNAMRRASDSLWTPSRITVSAPDPDTTEGRRSPRWYLARAFLSAGEWDRAADEGRGGAVELYLETTVLGMLKSAGRGLRAFSGNLITLAIVLAGLLAFSMLESFAVRSGRSIVQAVLDEMILLRRAAERFGAGDLGYRLPVTGKDEFSVVAGSLNDMAASLKRQQEELVAKERLEEDLRVAREIQQRFLPQGAPGLAGLDVAGVSLPSREVGGDLFYWFAHDDGSLGLALGDVSGKSVPAALLMSNVLSALRAQAMQRIDVAESLTRTNELIIDQIELGRFVTLFYGEVDPRAGELRYACAGHNPPLLLRAGGGIEWLREGGVPIGVLPHAEYAAARVPFAPGDTLIVYSDGVTEAEGPANTPTVPDLFGEERLAAVAAGGGDASARERIDALLQAVERFASGTPQADDITVLVVRRV